MPTTIQPIILTADLERLAAFYTGLLGATETSRVPDQGPPNDMPWGQRVAHVRDPDGNPLNLTQPTSTR